MLLSLVLELILCSMLHSITAANMNYKTSALFDFERTTFTFSACPKQVIKATPESSETAYVQADHQNRHNYKILLLLEECFVEWGKL